MSRVIDIGAAPASADCAQLGQTKDFGRINALEVKLYGAAIRARFGNPPPGSELRSIANRHDFGTYRTLGLAMADEAEDCPEVGRYAADVIDGLASWLEAGFAPPIAYPGDGSADTGGRGFDDIVMGALRTTRPNPDGSWPVADFAALHTNLAEAYPQLAADVRNQLELAV